MSDKNMAAHYFQQGSSLVKQAVQMERMQNFDAAKNYYTRAKSMFELSHRNATKAGDNKFIENASTSLSRCNQRIQELNDMRPAEPAPVASAGGASTGVNKSSGAGGNKKSGGGGGGKKDDTSAEKDEFMNRMESAILIEKPNVKWDDVAGLAEAKRALTEAVILPLKYSQFFVGERSPWRGILLYGPPGTGKSFLAKATATEANNSSFLTVSTSDLMSKWQGESEKLIKALFDTARAKAPSIIFIDEIDSLLSERSENDSESSRRIKTEFLIQMDGVGKSMEGVLLLSATNIPWGLDPAVRRRFEKKIYIPLPDPEARYVLFGAKLKNTPNNVTDDQKRKIAAMTEGYSGADLKILVREAAMLTIRKLQTATCFQEHQGMYYACPPGTPGSFQSSLMDLEPSKVAVPPVTYQDFVESIQKIRPSVSPGDLTRFEEWTREFGQEGG